MCSREIGPQHVKGGISIRYNRPVCRVCMNSVKAIVAKSCEKVESVLFLSGLQMEFSLSIRCTLIFGEQCCIMPLLSLEP